MFQKFWGVIFFLAFSPAAWAYDFEVNGIYYNILSSDDKTVEVTNVGDYSDDVIIPATVTNEGIEYRVTAIGDKAFYNCEGLTSVTIPNSVTTIGSLAFFSSGLTSITIPESVTAIGNYAFRHCYDLTSVTIGDGVTTIGNYAFYNCEGLMSVTIGKSVQTIGRSAFAYCNGLTSITIPESVTAIGDGAFYRCDGLTEFKGKFTVDNCCLIVNDTLKAFAPKCDVAEYTIPDGVKVVGYGAFSSCSGLTEITIPNSVTTIGDESFMGCTGLTSVTIPESVTTIGSLAFSSSGLTSITIPESVTAIGYRTFRYCTGLTSVTIPNSVTSIGDEAFSGCSSLTSVTIPESVTFIGDEAFFGCSGLTEFKGKFASDYGRCLIVNDTLIAFAPKCDVAEYTIPDDVKVIGEDAFRKCSGLKSVTIPGSVTAIGNWAFEYCTGLTSVTIPNSVTTIGNAAFWYCESLTSVTAYNPEPMDIGTSVFYGVDNGKLYVPKGSVEAYRNAEGWSEFEEILPIVAYDFEAAPTITPVENDETITALSTFTLTFDERPALVGSSATVMKADSSAYYPARITASEDGKSFIITLQGDEQTKAAEYSLTEAGTYLLVIPAGTFGDDVFAADPKTGHSNPELTYTYTIKAPEPVEPDEPDDPSSITETQQDAEHITVYNLQGVPVLETDDAADLKTLQNGAYIVNGKKMILVR